MAEDAPVKNPDFAVYQVLSALSLLGIIFISVVLYYVLKQTKWSLKAEPAFLIMLSSLWLSLAFNIAFF